MQAQDLSTAKQCIKCERLFSRRRRRCRPPDCCRPSQYEKHSANASLVPTNKTETDVVSGRRTGDMISSAQPSSNIASVRQSGPHADWRAFLCALASMPDGSGASAICCDSAMGPSKLYDQLRKVLLGFVRSACCSRPEVPRKALGPAVRGHAHLLVLYPPRFIRAREHQVHCQPFRDRWR